MGKRGALPLTNRQGRLLVEPRGDGEAGRAMGEMQVEQDEIGIMLFGRGDGAVGVLRGRDHAIARIVLDQIFECRRQLQIVFDDQNPEHPRALPDTHRKFPPENP